MLQRRQKLNRGWECLWIKIVPASTEDLLPASIGLVTFCCPEGRWDSPQAFLQNIFFNPCLVESQAPTRLPPLPSQPLPLLPSWTLQVVPLNHMNDLAKLVFTSPSYLPFPPVIVKYILVLSNLKKISLYGAWPVFELHYFIYLYPWSPGPGSLSDLSSQLKSFFLFQNGLFRRKSLHVAQFKGRGGVLHLLVYSYLFHLYQDRPVKIYFIFYIIMQHYFWARVL